MTSTIDTGGRARRQERVLVVDDDDDIRTVLSAVLGRAGIDTIAAADGREALRRLFEVRPDAVVLDVGLPDIDGFEVLRRIRDMSDVPVVMLTARGLERDKVEGLELGADDYVTKPFSNAELVARVQAALRRGRPGGDVVEHLADGPLILDLQAKVVRLDGDEVSVSPTEWNLLVTFLRHRGQILSPAQLLEQAWADPTGIAPERVKFAVLRLRRRLGWQEPETSPIEAVRGFGYRYRGIDGP